MKMSFENELGALKPVGFWDPLGLSKDIDAATFAQRRTAELKHGRVAMLAVTGYLVQSAYRFPGAESFPNGVDAFSALPLAGWFQIIAFAGYYEIFGWKQVEGSTVGDFDFYDRKEGEKRGLTPEKIEEFKVKELQNGRLAMLAIGELVTHDIYKPAGESLFAIHHF